MAYATPRVSAGYLCDDRVTGLTIKLDSPAWFAWLATPANVCFNYALVNRTKGYIDGYVTVRKEARQRGSGYWTAYRRQGKRLRKVYLGPSATVTLARIEAAVARLRARDGPAVVTS
jgi:LuxR family maltose regulon positive regulatory protein